MDWKNATLLTSGWWYHHKNITICIVGWPSGAHCADVVKTVTLWFWADAAFHTLSVQGWRAGESVWNRWRPVAMERVWNQCGQQGWAGVVFGILSPILGGKFTFRVLQIKIHHENDHSPPGFRTSLQGLKNKLTKLGRCDSYGKSENVTHSLTDSSTGGNY